MRIGVGFLVSAMICTSGGVAAGAAAESGKPRATALASSWTFVSERKAAEGAEGVAPTDALPEAYRAYRLRDARQAFTTITRPAATAAEVVLPLPDGRLQRFAASPASAMAPALAAKFPRIKSYRVTGLDAPGITGHISVTPRGVHASLLTPEGTVKIRRWVVNGETLHLTFFDHYEQAAGTSCGIVDLAPPTSPAAAPSPEGVPTTPTSQADSHLSVGRPGAPPAAVPATGSAVTHKTYELAITTTRQFFTAIADPVNDPEALDKVMEVVNDLVLDLNEIFERDLAVTFELVDGTEDLFFSDPGEDPFDNTKCACDLPPEEGGPGMQSQAKAVLNAAVPETIARYDVGHLLTKPGGESQPCQSGGCGLIGGVCGTNRGRGASKHDDPNNIDVGFQAHELGHQLGAGHTWSSLICSELVDSFPNDAYEPGGGSTLMGYTKCEADNIAASAEERRYFHNFTVGQIQSVLGGKTCQTSTLSGNRRPTVDTVPDCDCCTEPQLLPCVRIPPSTGFTLSGGTASDDGYGGTEMTFTWEQMDLFGSPTYAVVDDGPGDPLFRSFFPTEDGATRTFEDKGIPGEILPTSDRYINMRLVVRDNYYPAGGFGYNRMQLQVIGDPLVLTYPNGGEEIEHYGLTVTWDPGDTTTGLLGHTVDEVNILYSADGGDNWVSLTEEPTANDGSEAVYLPAICPTTFEALIKIEGTDGLQLSDRSDAVFRVYCPCPTVGSCQDEEDICGCHEEDTGNPNCWTGSELLWCYPGGTIETYRCKCDTSVGGGGIGHPQQCFGFPFIDHWGCTDGGVVDCPTLSTCGECSLTGLNCSEVDTELDVCMRPDYTLMICPEGKTIFVHECDCVTGLGCSGTGEVLRCCDPGGCL